jgi:hypothetical protein
MVEPLTATQVRRRSLEGLLTRANNSDEHTPEFDFSTPIDRRRWFVCPTLTPLFYAPVYRELSEDHQRRYNQLTALSFSELIGYFETSFAASVLATLAEGRRSETDRNLIACLEEFIAEERRHTEWWRQLNRLSEPELYRHADQAVIQISPFAQWLLGKLTRHPRLFPLVFWVMLALEERSLEISRRCLRVPHEQIEPRYLAIYRAHLAHEVRHVHIDWHLIERFYARQSALRRRLNAQLFCLAIRKFFLPPTQSAVRVTNRLVAECPELQPLQNAMKNQLAVVGRDPAYHQMMYSRDSTPITFSLFDRFEEFHVMSTVLHSYQPQSKPGP